MPLTIEILNSEDNVSVTGPLKPGEIYQISDELSDGSREPYVAFCFPDDTVSVIKKFPKVTGLSPDEVTPMITEQELDKGEDLSILEKGKVYTINITPFTGRKTKIRFTQM